jgi:hypothetical protein
MTSRGNRLIFVLYSLLAAPLSAGEELHTLIGYSCDAAADRLTLTYTGAYGEKGAALHAQKSGQQRDPGALVELGDEGGLHSRESIHAACALSDGRYDIELGAEPAKSQARGGCDMFVTAWASVRRGAETVLPHYAFDTCEGAFVIAAVVIRPGIRPMVRTVAKAEYFR